MAVVYQQVLKQSIFGDDVAAAAKLWSGPPPSPAESYPACDDELAATSNSPVVLNES